MNTINVDIAIIGGGAAGLTAASITAKAGKSTLVIERTNALGGVLRQCIHNGFGLHYFKEELTGPEYANKVYQQAVKAGASFMTNASVMEIAPKDKGHVLTIYSSDSGVTSVNCQAVILAMGCRERCRGNLGIPGERISGIFNAGFAQQLLNLEGYVPGKKAVIVGSGDIGLIMARRLKWSNVDVECVIEIMPYPAGLSRNIAQCLEDFNIPLYLSYTVTGIYGKGRVEYITCAPLVDGKADLTREKKIECDTVLFSVGLVPENELATSCGVVLDKVTNGAIVDGNLMTNVPGIFACGNVLHVHDLVDFVSNEAERCGAAAIEYCNNNYAIEESNATIEAGELVRYVVPQKVKAGKETCFFMRASSIIDKATLVLKDENGNEITSKVVRYVKPAEMLSINATIPKAGKYSFNLKEC